MNRKVQTTEDSDIAVTPDELAVWQHAMGYNDTEARTVLGIGSANTWRRYKEQGAPRLVQLAMNAVAHGLVASPSYTVDEISATHDGKVSVRLSIVANPLYETPPGHPLRNALADTAEWVLVEVFGRPRPEVARKVEQCLGPYVPDLSNAGEP